MSEEPISIEEFQAEVRSTRDLLNHYISRFARNLQMGEKNSFFVTDQPQSIFTAFMQAAAQILTHQIDNLATPKYASEIHGDIAFCNSVLERFDFSPSLEEIFNYINRNQGMGNLSGLPLKIDILEEAEAVKLTDEAIGKEPLSNLHYYFCRAAINTFAREVVARISERPVVDDPQNIDQDIFNSAVHDVIERAAACRAPVSMPGVG